MLEEAIKTFNPGNLSILNIDIMKNGFKDNDFDVIIANNSLHHVVDSGMISHDDRIRNEYIILFTELKRLLKPSSILSLEEYSRLCFWRWSPIKFKWKTIDWYLHPTLSEWLLVIRQSGLVLKNWKYVTPYKFRSFKIIFSNPIFQFFMYPFFYNYSCQIKEVISYAAHLRPR